MIPLLQDPADAGGAVRGVVVLGVFGIIQDLVDILRVRSLQKDDIRPPLLQVGADLDELVHMLRVGGGVGAQAEELPAQEALVAVVLALDGLALQAGALPDDRIEDPIDGLVPEPAVEIDDVVLILCISRSENASAARSP